MRIHACAVTVGGAGIGAAACAAGAGGVAGEAAGGATVGGVVAAAACAAVATMSVRSHAAGGERITAMDFLRSTANRECYRMARVLLRAPSMILVCHSI